MNLGASKFNKKLKKGTKNYLLQRALRGGGSLNTWPNNPPVFDKKRQKGKKSIIPAVKLNVYNQKKIDKNKKKYMKEKKINAFDEIKENNEKIKKRSKF